MTPASPFQRLPAFPLSEEQIRDGEDLTGIRLVSWQRDLLMGKVVQVGRKGGKTVLTRFLDSYLQQYMLRASRPRRMPLTPLTPNDNRHGKSSTYENYQCRCDPCREAFRKKMQDGREARLAKPIPRRVHGTNNGYSNYKCRCDACVKARSLWVAQRKLDKTPPA